MYIKVIITTNTSGAITTEICFAASSITLPSAFIGTIDIILFSTLFFGKI